MDNVGFIFLEDPAIAKAYRRRCCSWLGGGGAILHFLRHILPGQKGFLQKHTLPDILSLNLIIFFLCN